MKYFTKSLIWIMIAMLAFSFNSCDDDDEIIRTLEGTWRGNMFVAHRGSYSAKASYSEVCFLRDPYSYSFGDGYWVDYYDDNIWDGTNKVAIHIKWKVDMGTISISFVEDNDYVGICNFSLNDDYFKGDVVWGDGSSNQFQLHHVSSPNWSNFTHWGYSYYRSSIKNNSLEGTWRGNLYVYADWGNYSVNASYTEVCFLKDPYRYSSGTGYWVDYYDDYYWGGTNRVASHIEWKVDMGKIRIYFVEDGNYVDIENYSLNDDRFRGYISRHDGSRNEFEIYQVSSPNWNNFSHWGYKYYDENNYSNIAFMKDY